MGAHNKSHMPHLSVPASSQVLFFLMESGTRKGPRCQWLKPQGSLLLYDTTLLPQEEKRLRTAYLRAEDSEREKFSLFSAAVRESHEKERTRAERTKNWSLIGSVLGALIGVAGSTYVNRVRLQELKALLLEAQKGPASLQEAIREQASSYSLQQRDLQDLMVNLRGLVHAG